MWKRFDTANTMTEKLMRIKDLTSEELKGFVCTLGEKPFRAKQIYEWMYKGAGSFAEMTNLSKELRNKLSESASLFTLSIADFIESKEDETCKFLFETEDNEIIEAVFMKYKYGNSICISSQAGCKMGCIFCASGMNGLSRDLTPGEMADQFIMAQHVTGQKIRHVVIMGIGEPFENYDNIKKFIENLSRPEGLGLSRRNITVSTCGIIPYIERFAEDLPQVNLAISLHAPNDNIRDELMPINSKYRLSDLIQASREYVEKTGRRVSFEYVLIKGINDRPGHAEELAKLLKGLNCHVNLIPINQVKESVYKPSSDKDAAVFMNILEEKRIQVTKRRELGKDIDAACGQLRLKG